MLGSIVPDASIKSVQLHNGSHYVGQLTEDNKPDGMGFICFQHGAKYFGGMSCGKQEGLGVAYYPSGTLIEGHWKENKQCSPGMCRDLDGNYFPIYADKETSVHSSMKAQIQAANRRFSVFRFLCIKSITDAQSVGDGQLRIFKAEAARTVKSKIKQQQQRDKIIQKQIRQSEKDMKTSRVKEAENVIKQKHIKTQMKLRIKEAESLQNWKSTRVLKYNELVKAKSALQTQQLQHQTLMNRLL